MATLAHTLNLDIAFFNELVYRAYPNIDEVKINFMKELVDDGVIQIETLYEKAISVVGNLGRSSKYGMDFVDNSDAKKVSVHGYGLSEGKERFAAIIKDVHTKVGTLRVMCYERTHNKFYYFKIPHDKYNHITKATQNLKIPFNSDRMPYRYSGRAAVRNWWDFEVSSFEEMSS